MKIYLGTDHGGFALKETIKAFLLEKGLPAGRQGYEVVDCGANTYEKSDDYPTFIAKVGEAVSKNPTERGIIFGGSGQAEAMLANKYKNVRCALFYCPHVAPRPVDVNGRKSDDPYEMIRLTREHNDANVLSLGERFLTDDEAKKAVEIWLATPFSNEERHARRIKEISEIEGEI